MVTALSAESTGRWWVVTEFSRHLFDLDAQTYERYESVNEMRKDHTALSLPPTAIAMWPEVGSVFQIIVQVADSDDVYATVRTSSLIREIVEVS